MATHLLQQKKIKCVMKSGGQKIKREEKVGKSLKYFETGILKRVY